MLTLRNFNNKGNLINFQNHTKLIREKILYKILKN
jgi:hypothetical protein